LQINSPLFAVTSDIDWASEASINDMMQLFARFGIRPTLFATHRSDAIEACERDGTAQIGVHPNFLPKSTHGNNSEQVIETVTGLFPRAEVFRSHSFFDNSHITQAFFERGYRYDSNICLYLEQDIRPLRHSSGLTRFPVFWEDDVHWSWAEGDWEVDHYIDRFMSPGLKIINVHPIHVALNTPNGAFYKSLPAPTTELAASDIGRLRHRGPGTRTFIEELLERLSSQRHRFYVLGELFAMFQSEEDWARKVADRPVAKLTKSDHARYWSSDEDSRQAALRRIYDQRDPTDPYATSRDSNQRELEIEAIRRVLAGRAPGRLLDLGCGNGYTLISIAKTLADWTLTGIDFSRVLIDGAKDLAGKARSDLISPPDFICADAVEYLERLPPATVDIVLTERFLLNLPSVDAQRRVIRDAYRAIMPGGLLLMCEGSLEGHRELNRLRQALELDAIPETSADNISAIRFEDEEIEAFVRSDVGFELLDKQGFSTFFAISRVLHPILVAPQAPRFSARINVLARAIQLQLPFKPGVGSNVLWILQKPPFGN
jgi:SAM-dependent methyltransferase